jgi:hypothetical protein
MPPDTEAVPEALLVHVPPPVASVSVTVLPVHTDADEGEMLAGFDITVTDFVAEQLPNV